RALNIPAGQGMATYAAWAVDPERDSRPLVLLAADQEQAHEMRDHLVRVGIDAVGGYVTGFEGLPLHTPGLIRPEALDGFDSVLLLDVRAKSEHTAGHIPGSPQLHGGRVLWNLDQIPDEGTIVTYCQSGVRSSVVASTLRHKGYDVVELDGSYLAWAAQQDSLASTSAR
ncbi:MAG: rhodanese-like domain-containing protein, partial [Cryobacterium sp.]